MQAAAAGPRIQLQLQPVLLHMIAMGSLPGGRADLALVARALLLALVAQLPGLEQFQVGFDVLHAVKHALFGQRGAAELTRQLAELEEECRGNNGAPAPEPRSRRLGACPRWRRCRRCGSCWPRSWQ